MGSSEGQLIKTALGEDWLQLSEITRQRFLKVSTIEKPILYKGLMDEIKTSPIGKLFAFFGRFLNAPLVPYSENNVPIEVEVLTVGKEVHKKRRYLFKNYPSVLVNSIMRTNGKGGFFECIEGGLSMQMKLYVKNGVLYFESIRYLLQFKKLRLTIPILLTPGKTKIIHQEIDKESFSVQISMIHPWFGLLFFQRGVFTEASD